MSDLVSRQQAINAIRKLPVLILPGGVLLGDVLGTIRQLPSAQPEQPLLDTYAKAVWTWLIDYQIKAAELKGRYAPYEVLSWVANDWRKEHDMPSAEPQIIRCKDCKHWIPYDWMFSEEWQSQNIDDYPEDDIGCDCCDMAMKANDFCSRGEKREVTT